MVKKALSMPGVDVAAKLAEQAAGAAAPAVEEEKKEEVSAIAAEVVKQEVKEVTKTKTKVNAKVKQKKEENPSAADLLKARAAKETKGVAMNLRVKPSVKEKFEQLRKQLNYSQSDFFEVLVQLAEETVREKK